MAMAAIHHLSCGTLCPPLIRYQMICHCLLIEHSSGLVLVDTGFGKSDLRDGGAGLPRAFRMTARPSLDLATTAREQLSALGHRAEDVRHIVVTHLDLDHAGGLTDFPRASVHVHAIELDAALARRTFRERRRYLPNQFRDVSFRSYADDGDSWNGMSAIMPLDGLDDDIALVPLFGHSRGHSGVAVRKSDGTWLLHAGDAYFHHSELVGPSRAPRPVQAFQLAMDMDRDMREANRDRLGQLSASADAGVDVFCAHDQTELARLQGKS